MLLCGAVTSGIGGTSPTGKQAQKKTRRFFIGVFLECCGAPNAYDLATRRRRAAPMHANPKSPMLIISMLAGSGVVPVL
jgi:hypothetical protein